MALPALARRTPLLQQSIDISCPRAHTQQQTCSGEFAAVGPCWDRQTDGRTDGHRTVSQTLFRMLFGQCRYLYVNCCTTVETSYTANPLQIKVTELEGYSWPTCSKQPRLIDCRIGVVNKLDHRDRVDKKWRNFLSPEFPTKFPGEVYVFWRHPDFLITQYKIGQKVSVPKTGSIRPAVIIKTWTDRQTGGRTTTANAALA